MQETGQAYAARISGYVAGRDHLAVLRDTPKKLVRLIGRATQQRLVKRRDPDTWSVGEILAHMAESEIVLGYRLRLVLGANGTQIQSFDQDRWQGNAGYLSIDPKSALALFKTLREANIALLRSLPKERWRESGLHQERGVESVARMVELLAGHDVNHTTQIAASLRR